MIKFDPQNYPYPSKRNVVYARNGMCNAGNPHAASAGLQTLLKAMQWTQLSQWPALCRLWSQPATVWVPTAS